MRNMMRKQKSSIEALIDLLPDKQKNVFQEIACYLVELGYIPQKQQVKDYVLSFKHQVNGKVIAKMGFRKQNGFVSVRFFACKDVPEKYVDALRRDLDAQNEQYSGPRNSRPASGITSQCGYCGDICTGGRLGYAYKYPDGREITRCGAYPIVIPDVKESDVAEMKKVILEQHQFFLSIA